MGFYAITGVKNAEAFDLWVYLTYLDFCFYCMYYSDDYSQYCIASLYYSYVDLDLPISSFILLI